MTLTESLPFFFQFNWRVCCIQHADNSLITACYSHSSVKLALLASWLRRIGRKLVPGCLHGYCCAPSKNCLERWLTANMSQKGRLLFCVPLFHCRRGRFLYLVFTADYTVLFLRAQIFIYVLVFMDDSTSLQSTLIHVRGEVIQTTSRSQMTWNIK